MNWEDALRELGDGSAVHREDWDADTYLDAAFGGPGESDESEWPFTDSRGNRFQVIEYDEGDKINGHAYAFTDEDKAATDWELA